MTLKPIDIEKKSFTRVFRGYDEAEVESFLEDTSKSFTNVLTENNELKDRLRKFQIRVDELTTREKTVNETLTVVRKISDDMKENAQKESDHIVNEAKRKGRDYLISLQDEIKNFKTEIAQYKLKKIEIRNSLYQYLKGQISLVENPDVNENTIYEDSQEANNSEETNDSTFEC